MTRDLDMIVTLTETGGWTNVRRTCTVDTAELPPEDARRLERDCLLALTAPARDAPAGVRDARTLTLEVVADGASRSASYSEAAAPRELRPVLETLRPLCRVVPAAAR